MPDKAHPRIGFRARSRSVPPNIPAAVQRATSLLLAKRSAAVAQVPEWEGWRQAAHDARLEGISHLDEYIKIVQARVQSAGGNFHLARDSAQACALVVEIARAGGVRTVVKSKSMATEEIALNHALEEAGIASFETDVGEFIIQMAGVGPSHILGPTLHMTKEDIAELFTRKLGIDAPPDPRALTDIARSALRERFLSAEMGISGANFVVAETGTVVLVTNEGNGRLCTTLPDIHIAVAGIDKIIPDWNSLAALLRVLPRNATGQKLSTYTSFITGPRRSEGEEGAREFHLILLDNGRSRVRSDPASSETLLCIRCAACLNICPVYNQVGGHAYGGAYSGPIGAILSPQLLGTNIAGDLPFASSLCGACTDVCPVKIPIPSILLHLRHRIAEGQAAERPSLPFRVRLMASLASIGLSNPWLYHTGAFLLRLGQRPFQHGDRLTALPPPLNRWTNVRPFPAFRGGFPKWWHTRRSARSQTFSKSQNPESSLPARETASQPANLSLAAMDRLIQEVNLVAGHAQHITLQEIDAALAKLVAVGGIKKAALWQTDYITRLALADRLRKLGVNIIPATADKRALAEADLGITEVDFALPESGTLGLLSSPDRSRSISVLPRTHLAVVRPQALRPDLQQVFQEAKNEGYLVFITGPSRTSDIESVPTLGAHGPEALYVWAMD